MRIYLSYITPSIGLVVGHTLSSFESIDNGPSGRKTRIRLTFYYLFGRSP